MNDMEYSEAYDEGWRAGYDDQHPDCPYAADTPEYLAWQEGYDQGCNDC